MKWWYIAAGYVVLILVFSVIHLIAKNKRPVKRAFLSSFFGFLSLIAINLLSIFTQVSLPISLLSTAVSVTFGLPGVTLMLLLNVLL